jgi:hypothetical protein
MTGRPHPKKRRQNWMFWKVVEFFKKKTKMMEQKNWSFRKVLEEEFLGVVLKATRASSTCN